MRKSGDLKITVAIGLHGGAILLSIEEANEQITNDLKEYGGFLDELFYQGSELPVKAGIYNFIGEGFFAVDEYSFVDETQYLGEFKLIKGN